MVAYHRMGLSHLRADCCTPGSAPGPTLGNQYGRTLSFYFLRRAQVNSDTFEHIFYCCIQKKSISEHLSVYCSYFMIHIYAGFSFFVYVKTIALKQQPPKFHPWIQCTDFYISQQPFVILGWVRHNPCSIRIVAFFACTVPTETLVRARELIPMYRQAALLYWKSINLRRCVREVVDRLVVPLWHDGFSSYSATIALLSAKYTCTYRTTTIAWFGAALLLTTSVVQVERSVRRVCLCPEYNF